MKLIPLAVIAVLILPGAANIATAADGTVDCLMCHSDLVDKQKVEHPAAQMGCPTCHSGIDASEVPHKKTTNFPKGLSADQPDLCYSCHDKERFTKKHVHPAISMGCTACHNPHASQNEKLLIAPVPDLCFNCHDKADFTHKNVHPPVAGGMCLTCHDPHSSENYWLTTKPQPELCLDCHDDIAKKPHVVNAVRDQGHPLGFPKLNKKTGKYKLMEDPARKGKPFGCSSCHNPHSSDDDHLFRYQARTMTELCENCHKF